MSDKIIKVDLEQYASRLYKFDLFHDEEYRLYTSKGLKFLHFNQNFNLKELPKPTFRIWQNRTVAVLALSPTTITNAVSAFLTSPSDNNLLITMAIGVAFVSRDDNYSRKIGRDESVKKMVEIDLEVVAVNINKNHIHINLAPYQGIALVLRLNKKTGFSTVTGKITGLAKDRP